MSHVVQASRPPEPAPQRSDVGMVVDVALGLVGDSIGTGVAVLRATARCSPMRSRAAWRPTFIPTRLQPASLVLDVATRGVPHREWAAHRLERLLDEWTPAIAELVVSRMDLTGLVKRYVRLDDVVSSVDLDAIASRLDVEAVIDRVDLVSLVEEVIAAIDLPAIIRESTGSMASDTVRGARLTGISVDEAVSRSLERHLFRRRGSRTPVAEAP